MDSLSKSIRDNPIAFLPEPSLQMLRHFRIGYDLRRGLEGQPYEWADDNEGHFAAWVRKRFQVSARALNHLQVISSFAPNEVVAFQTYFDLLQDYANQHQTELSAPNKGTTKRVSFVELLGDLRQRKYFADPTFRGCCAFLMGEGHAYQDLRLPPEENRTLFSDFQRWVEDQKNRALPRPWFKVIYFWGGEIDCCHTSGAFSVFWDWLDEYTQQVGKPSLFRPSNGDQ